MECFFCGQDAHISCPYGFTTEEFIVAICEQTLECSFRKHVFSDFVETVRGCIFSAKAVYGYDTREAPNMYLMSP